MIKEPKITFGIDFDRENEEYEQAALQMYH